ncbi:hypothetical protein [Kribbella deserti]|uniref:Uncharacterized protein n=1 Tax=Kribbella deserti TaxID=1926257 RepID=A0ABV6QRB1_9ACTN
MNANSIAELIYLTLEDGLDPKRVLLDSDPDTNQIRLATPHGQSFRITVEEDL